ncbi:chromosome segregation protein SMC [Eubacteriales bacterium OttesenSCG-928-M02]|nr:chromosome segregation protein SMC [Eubacteriales bacterium OttesenSCG-928-M02]
MHLKRIDIHGFKSFGDKCFVDFSPGITAIVGPNGSGKSNVADAVRWVLGEQSARALRGSKMEDVIFSGTGNRKPLGYCEVILTFDNEDGTLPFPYTEVAVSRRLYRSGESEYAINRTPCRMRDIVTAFYDTGVGREGYSIIGQGKIEEILSPKGEERRAAFEEAAGVMKYKVRKVEAERKLKNVESSMLRVSDIMAELEGSLLPLGEQAEAAREFLSLRARLRTVDVSLFVEQYDRGEKRLENMEEEIRTLEVQEKEANQREATLKEEEELEYEKLSVVDSLLERAREKQVLLTGQAGQTTSKKDVLNERKESTLSNLERIKRELHRDQEMLQEIGDTLSSFETGQGVEDLSALSQEIQQLLEERDALRAVVEQLDRALDEKKQAQLDATIGEGERKSRLARQAAIAEQAKGQMDRVQETILRAQEEVEGLSKELEEAQALQAGLTENRETIETELKQLAPGILEGEQRLEKGQALIQELVQKAAAARHRATIQKELKRNMEGYAQSVRNLMQDVREGDHILSQGVFGAVGDLVRTPKQYEIAIGQALSAQAQNIIVADEAAGKRLINHLREKDYGRATFLPLTALKPRAMGRDADAYLNRDGVIGPAMDLVSYDDAIKTAVEYLLGRTLVVRDMDTGVAISKESGYRFRCVTLEGDILNAGGTMTGGSNRDRGFISRDRLIKEAEAEAAALDKQAAEYEEKRQTLSAQLIEAQQRLSAGEGQLRQLDIDLAQNKEKLDAISYQLERAKEEAARYETEKDRLLAAIKAGEEPEEQSATDLALLEGEIRRESEALGEKRQELNGLEEALITRQITLSARQSETAAREQEERRLIREKERLEKAIQAGEANLAELDQRLVSYEEELSGIVETAQDVHTQVAENEAALTKLNDERQNIETRRRAIAQEREVLTETISTSMDRRYRLGNQRERLLAERENLQNRLWTDYQLTYAQAETEREEGLKYNAATQEANAIRARLLEMGDVNPNAIEEYQRVKERFDFLNSQSEDLLKAKADLEALIADLMATMQDRFIEQFRMINENFQRTFTALFKGGEAELVLTDEQNAMDCEIEIIAQPPGKRLQMISLLSGGERALTAIAILFAMLDLKATPFCILDEIESALDEENLRLFADYLKNYADKTQFIAITHRRPTMEVADSMYGVTMEEKGVSKLVSVRFADM